MPQPGDTIGSYVLDALLAEGGMGAVYRARNRVTGQPRALKIIREAFANRSEFVDRFVREATIASQVRHPNLVETLEPGIDGGVIYLPMELLEGETLSARLRRERMLPPAEAVALLAPVCEATALLHQRGLVHRDLKPMNVFLARQGGVVVPKVLDFGTARDVEDDEHTTTGMVIGSPYYMAPEQAEGRRDLDGRCDQYAIGVMAYQMLTGARPYESDDSRSALAKLLRGDPYVPPRRVFPGVPPALEAVIERALQRERDARFPSVLDLAHALRAALVAPMPGTPSVGAPMSGTPTIMLSTPLAPADASPTSAPFAGASAGAFAPPPIGGESMASGLAPSGSAASGPFAPPPPVAVAPTAGPRRTRAVLAVVVLVALAGLAGAAAWSLSSPTVTATPLAPATPPGVGAPVPVAPVPMPTAPAPVAPAPVASAPVAPAPVAPAPVAPEPATVAPTPPTPPAPSPATPRPPAPEPRDGVTVDTPSTPRHVPAHHSAPRAPASAPCGAATGIPCLD